MITSTTWLIVLLFALALWHFVWDGIIVPSMLIRLRYQLFALRDRLRRLKIEQQDRLSDEIFHMLDGSINDLIDRLPHIDMIAAFKAEWRLREDPCAEDVIGARKAIVQQCGIAEVQDIENKCLALVQAAIGTNSGGWLPYLLPVAGLVYAIQWSRRMWLSAFKRSAESIVFADRRHIDSIIPLHANSVI